MEKFIKTMRVFRMMKSAKMKGYLLVFSKDSEWIIKPM